ncbi:MAG: HAMP domain-containing protein [Opitutaceae bacterium]|nr:HAMP domain-containing protein [Opitutaceae bacterium]
MKSFTLRLTLQFAGLVTATTAIVLTVGGFLLDREVERSLELLHEVEARELFELVGNDSSLTAAAIADRIRHDADSDAALFVIQVAKTGGEVVFRSNNLGETILPVDGSAPRHWTTTIPYFGRVHVSASRHGPWLLQIGSPLEPSERLIEDYIRISIFLLIGSALLSLVLGYGFSRATLRPLRAIEETAERIGADHLTERIPTPAGRDELASLTNLLNRMLDRLHGSFEQVRRFTADASHELKTPLALIQLNAEKLRAKARHDPDCAATVTDILEEISRLQQMIDRLLFLAHADSGALTTAFRHLETQALLATLADDAIALAEDRHARFAIGRNEPGTLRGEFDLLRQLLLNVVGNAVNAAPPGSGITLESHAEGPRWVLSVLDEGPGMTPAQLERAFDRFVRFAPPAGAAPGPRGHGLGLAICKGIVELHGGTIRLENRRDRSGLRVRIELPRVES